MACIKSAPRSALAAFAPNSPYLAAGTMAGAVDLSFSSSANIEIFKLDFVSDDTELQAVGSCSTAERFNRLSWGKPLSNASEEFALGLIAGGHGDGTIGVWNPLKLIDSSEQDSSVASVGELKKHTGPVRGLEFCGLSPNLLASGADEGELCLWDLAKPSEPSHFPPLKGVGSGAQAEISCLSWNPKFQHILASTSYNGITVVWDLRQQKPLTSFSDSTKRRCSVLQWNPDMSTQFIVASDDDNSPALRLWDVRKTMSPVREYVGHSKGVIAMSWCPHDNSYLLTCAKDNRTICWDTFSGEIVCELPASTNWNFDVHWYPKIPGVISASSFDVKIGIYNIEACNHSMVGGGFGGTARLKSPKWFKRPTGASFGFGGKLVSFQPAQSAPNATVSSDVFVRNLVTEETLVSRSTEFETAIQNGERPSLRALCEKKSEESISDDEREIWGFLKVMFEEEGTARTKLLAHLGFNVPNETDEIGKSLIDNLSLDELNKGTAFEDGDGTAFPVDNGEEFFNNPQPSEDIPESSDVSNAKQIVDEEKDFLERSDSSVDDSIQRALVVGDYKVAVSLCISANRMADALVIANVGGPALWESTRDLYLKKSLSPYLKVVCAMVNNDLMSLVNSRPLSSWKETLALVCTFAQKEEWTILCDTLASRLMTGGNKLAATLCYICAGNIEKTVEIWSHSLKSESEGRAYVDLLQDLMEKTIILAFATGQKRFSPSLSKLVENYVELLASQGLLRMAMEYLKLLGSKESSHELAILQDRIALSAAETEASKTAPYEGSIANQQPFIGADGATYGHIESSRTKYQENTQQAPLQQTPSNQYVGGFEPSYGSSYGGQQGPQRPQFQDYANPPFQPAPVQMSSYQPAAAQTSTSFQPAPAQMNSSFQPAPPQLNSSFQPAPPQLNSSFQPAPTQMFMPSQTAPTQMPSFASPPTQQGARTFVPQNPPVLKNAGQYQQPTLGSQLYPGANVYQPAPPTQASQLRFQPNVTATPPAMSFVPGTGSNFPRPGVSPAQPSSPTQPAQVAAPPPPTVQTVDTSNVSAELKPVLATLTRLYRETTEALGGSNANLARKREIEDNSRKIGSLFAKLNSGDISPNAASKLIQLCQALDSGDFPTALHIQVVLTTSDWDECNFWLAALKRMIKVRQNARI